MLEHKPDLTALPLEFQEVGCSLFWGEGREKIGEVLLQLYQPQDEDHEAI